MPPRTAGSIGAQKIVLGSVGSTNKSAADLIRLSKVQHGAVIVANEQTEGRGQRGRTWHSHAGLDLTFSVVLMPGNLRAEEQFVLSQVAALAVRDTVAEYCAGEVRIKWPNDVLVDRRKVAGILIECELEGERLRSVVVGVGINVNSSEFDEDIAATSLRLEHGSPVDLELVLDHVLERFEHYYGMLRSGREQLSEAYRQWLWARGRWADLLLDGQLVSGRPMDIDAHGRLLVEFEDGKVAAHGLDRLRFAPR